MNDTVMYSTRLWSQEVSEAEASEALDYAGPGQEGLALLVGSRKDPAYEFTGGRKFKSKKNPYT